MGSDDIGQLLVLILLLFLSAFFSSAETAFTTVNKIRMRTLAEDGNKRAKRVLKITDNSGKMLGAILIGNNIVNLSASSLATTLAIRLFGSVGAGIATGVLTLLILIFGEISPKTLASLNADSLALAYSGVIYWLMKLLTPLIIITNALSHAFLRLLGIKTEEAQTTLTEEELRTIVDVSHENGIIEKEERQMINNVFDFGDAQVKEIMVPRIDMMAVSIDSTYDELIDTFRENRFTRIPVYKDTTDNVIGILNIKDLLLFQNTTQFSVKDAMREPFYTYEHKNISELFVEMKQSPFNLAIVLDEYGSTAGLITLEDMVEEIVGEIRDDYDEDETEDIQQISNTEYLVAGSMNLEDLCEQLDLDFVSEDYDSIGGYFIELLDHLPFKGEQVLTPDHVLLRAEKVSKNRIETVYMNVASRILADEDDSD
ncbi:MAG: HlyC/CorC family transporter [Lachnospiraceae bacterium]